MKKSMDTSKAADLWNITKRRVTKLCSQGKIQGCIKQNGKWMIPIDAKKPSDGRRKIISKSQFYLPLPLGISDFKAASKNYYYVDKTLMIKDILDERLKVSLFTRPRRFGKTMNMEMLRTFIEKTAEDTSIYFKDKKIWKCGGFL